MTLKDAFRRLQGNMSNVAFANAIGISPPTIYKAYDTNRFGRALVTAAVEYAKIPLEAFIAQVDEPAPLNPRDFIIVSHESALKALKELDGIPETRDTTYDSKPSEATGATDIVDQPKPCGINFKDILPGGGNECAKKAKSKVDPRAVSHEFLDIHVVPTTTALPKRKPLRPIFFQGECVKYKVLDCGKVRVIGFVASGLDEAGVDFTKEQLLNLAEEVRELAGTL